MNAAGKTDIDEATRTALAELALGDPELLGESLQLRAELQARSGLDPRSFALVKDTASIMRGPRGLKATAPARVISG